VLLDLRKLSAEDPEPQVFVVDQMVPEGEPTLITGHGGSVKSWLALQMAVCIAAPKKMAWLGKLVKRRRVAFFSFEDGKDELHRRLDKIYRYFHIPMRSLDGWLHVYDGVRSDALLFRGDARGGMSTTAAYDWLKDKVRDQEIGVTFIDGVADVYGGNVNDAPQVKAFVRAMLGAFGTVVLVAHVNKLTAQGQQSSETYSGTAQWHNAVRSRLFVKGYYDDGQAVPVEGENGDDDDQRPNRHPDYFRIRQEKTNRGDMAAILTVRWDEALGLPVYVSSESRKAKRAAENDQRKAWLLDAIDKANGESNPIRTATRGPSNVTQRIRQMPGCPHAFKTKSNRVTKLLEELVSSGQVVRNRIKDAGRHEVEIYGLAQ
jgi:RecA-family ATPase